MTPKGARLVCSKHDNIDTDCCLDQAASGVPTLTCIDGRYGDCYPCSAPMTVRLCLGLLETDKTVLNESRNLETGKPREQKLNVLLAARHKSKDRSKFLKNTLGSWSLKYCAASMLGWILLIGLFIFSVVSGSYIAAIYLPLMPITGLLISLLHGGSSRELDDRKSEHQRLIVMADNMNATEWWAMYGGSFLINSFLNRSLSRKSRSIKPMFIKPLLQLAILSQWILAVASSAQQSWSALIISFWVLWCAISTEYIYRSKDSVQDWLYHTCHISLHRIRTKFSSRRAMLSALVLLNPDTTDNRIQWIDPILADGPERSQWLDALMTFIERQNFGEGSFEKIFCSWIEEGIAVGSHIRELIGTWLAEVVKEDV